jgi:Ca2+/Na+ antiporter
LNTEQISVGIGALAGSTIMLLTIPWFLSIVGGRVNLNPDTGMPSYKQPKLTEANSKSLTASGVTISKAVNNAAWLILFTSVGYFLLQVPGLVYLHDSTQEQAAGEKTWVMIGLVLSIVFFLGYLYQQYKISQEDFNKAELTIQQVKQEETLRTAIMEGKITLSAYMTSEYDRFVETHPDIMRNIHKNNENDRLVANETTPLKGKTVSTQGTSVSNIPEEFLKHLERIIKPFFKEYDKDNNNTLDLTEMRRVFSDLGESNMDEMKLKELFAEFDVDQNEIIDYGEFVLGVAKYIMDPRKYSSMSMKSRSSAARRTQSTEKAVRNYVDVVTAAGTGSGKAGAAGEEAEPEVEEEEEEEIPDDLKGLSPEEIQFKIKWRSFMMMLWGTFVVLLFSDPMVDILSEIGRRTGIPAFYVAFVAAPLASNASELIASYNYAQKKTSSTISISLATLEGAAVMNNTFVLGERKQKIVNY